ncbi:MAG: FAD binding domain-containing protein [bacterium]
MNQTIKILFPKNAREACELLSENKNSKIIAGGTDIIPGFHIESSRFKNVNQLIDINSIREIKSVELNPENISIGAGLTFAEIISNPILNKRMPLIVKSAKTVGSLQIRNRATIGGNFINNAPCADSVPPLLLYDAKIKIRSLDEERILPLEDFLLKPYSTQLRHNEVVTQIIIPVNCQKVNCDFYKLGRRRGVSISRISLAILMKSQNGRISGLRIACGAVTPVGIRLHELEQKFIGVKCSDKSFKEIAIGVGEKILEVTGLRWSSEYKIPVLQQMVYQLFKNMNEKQ